MVEPRLTISGRSCVQSTSNTTTQRLGRWVPVRPDWSPWKPAPPCGRRLWRGQLRLRLAYKGDCSVASALPLLSGVVACHQRLDRPSAWPAPPSFLCPLCPVPGGLSGITNGTPWGGRQGGGGQEEGLVCTGGEEPEGGRGLPFHLHLGPGEGYDPPQTLGSRVQQ